MGKYICVRGIEVNRPDVTYCGRGTAGWKASPLANPCSVPNKICPMCQATHYGAGMVRLSSSLPCYRKWLWQRIKASDMAVLIALRRIEDDTPLGCWCTKYEECHTSIVHRAAQWLYLDEMHNEDLAEYYANIAADAR